MALLADRSDIPGALAMALAMADGEPSGWIDGLKAFERLPSMKYLLGVTDTLERTENYAPRLYFCQDNELLDLALLEGCKNLTGATFWMVHGREMLHALAAKKLKTTLGKWE
jgi:hypothetical protein